MRLTIHARGSIDASAGKAATNPVTTVDVALSEDVTRKLALCMRGVPKKEADATKFLNDKATPPSEPRRRRSRPSATC